MVCNAESMRRVASVGWWTRNVREPGPRGTRCTDGLVFLTYTIFKEAVGEEVERLEVVPCRRCASEAGG